MGRNWPGPLAAGLIVSMALGCASTNDRKGQSGSVTKNARQKEATGAARSGEKRTPARTGPMLTSPDPNQTFTQVPSPLLRFEETTTPTDRSGLLLLATPPSSNSDAQSADTSGPRQPRLKGGDDVGWTKTNSLVRNTPSASGIEAVRPASTSEPRESWSTPGPQHLLLREVTASSPSNPRTSVAPSGPVTDMPRSTSQPPSAPRAGLASPGPRPGATMDHAADYSWIQGRLEYSVVGGGVWKVRYASPSTDDEHGGSVVLDSDPSAQGCQPGDTVYVQGQVAASPQARTLSNPSYRVQKLVRVE